MLFNVTVFWVCVGVCIVRALRLIIATVTNIAAIVRTVGLTWIIFITPRLPALWMTVNPNPKPCCVVVCSLAEVSRYRAALSVALVADPFVAFQTSRLRDVARALGS
jgi:hypothetical protein